MRNVILVLGMHRSGTSAAAGFLVKLGGAQPKTLMPAEGGNERGYFESQALMTFHDELLASAGSSWADWRQFNPAWYQSPAAPAFRERAKQLFHEEFDGEPLAVLKDPRVCRFAPFWLEVLAGMKARVRVVIPVRAPLEVAFSMQKRFGFSLATGVLLWLRHIIDAEIASRALPRSIFTGDQLLRDWRGVAEKTSTELGLRWPRLSDATAYQIENFLGYDLVHHRVSKLECAAHPDIHEWTMSAYRAMLKLARKPRSRSALKKLDKTRDLFNRASRMFGRTVLEDEIRSQELLRETAKLAEERDHWSRQYDAARAELAGALHAKEQISVELNARACEASDLAQARAEQGKLRRPSETVTRSHELSEDASPMDAQSYFSTKLVDMGELDSGLKNEPPWIMKAAACRGAANAAMMLDSVIVGDLDLRAYGWLLPYKERSVSGFEVIVDGHSAPAVWQQHDSPDIAQVMRNVPGSERARFDLRADFLTIRRRNSIGVIRATFDDGSHTFAMFPIASDIPIPDQRLAGMVGGCFSQVGFEFLAHLIKFGGLRHDTAVLDVGCGCGRIAYGLAHYLSQQGSYVGFDTMKGHIEWARDVMARDLSQFTFIHADITNQQYNPAGTIRSTDYRFPCDENSVGLCVATSLFTHLLKEDCYHYIKETARILKNGGRSFMTAFVMSDEAKRSVASGFALQDIRHPIDQEGILTARPDVPEAVIGIEEQMLFSWVADAGLEVEQFYPGWWAHKNSPTYQDILVLRKK